ncbi:hypothetical protein Patl1_34733 [Pistacia atlantica]|uniref:Uncharacterized protein n=1 Tax=Pistacia atlantica TaxID=434234 RepID=A0ACC0ZPX8_9ROSI|nr:hypothetical protein Patl1_34733 [Pistacia atlantica]
MFPRMAETAKVKKSLTLSKKFPNKDKDDIEKRDGLRKVQELEQTGDPLIQAPSTHSFLLAKGNVHNCQITNKLQQTPLKLNGITNFITIPKPLLHFSHPPFHFPPPTHFTKPSLFTSPDHLSKRSPPPPLPIHITQAKKKNPWLDPFDDGEDPDMEYGSLFADGKQDEDPRPPDNPDNPYGFLKFPMGFNVEIASLPLKIRGDVRRCCCVVSGGVYENLLFFPAIQLLKDR